MVPRGVSYARKITAVRPGRGGRRDSVGVMVFTAPVPRNGPLNNGNASLVRISAMGSLPSAYGEDTPPTH